MRIAQIVLLIWGILLMTPSRASARESGVVLSMTRPLSLGRTQPRPAKLFYVSLGMRDGLKMGDLLTVFEDRPVFNEMTQFPEPVLPIAVGQLKVTQVGEFYSLAQRTQTDRDKEQLGLSPFIEIGDRVQKLSVAPL